MSAQREKIAVIGFGTVGAGVVKILQEQGQTLSKRTGIAFEVGHVVDTDLKRERPVTVPAGVLHDDLQKVLDDKDVSIAVELVGGTTIAAEIHKKLLAAGKHVVTANKALLAERGPELFAAARKHQKCIAFEASCCGGIPVISALRTGLAANNITAMYGIVNGTCNYILSGMSNEGKTYADALREAQEAGYAEADPTLDVNGGDSAHKLAIMATLAYGVRVTMADIEYQGINEIELVDILYGMELGYVMKLLAIAEQTEKGLWLQVLPSFINAKDPLAQVQGSFNAVSIFGDTVGHTSFYGRGAGMMPTASAVVADIIEVGRGNSERIFRAMPGFGEEAEAGRLCPNEEIKTRFYLRMMAVDHPGALAQISKVLGDRHISISTVMQHEMDIMENDQDRADMVPVVIMTHPARRGDVQEALKELEQLEMIKTRPVCIHVVNPPVDE